MNNRKKQPTLAQLEATVFDFVGRPSEEGFRAVRDKRKRWFHVSSKGERLYSENYNWVGRFRKGEATVMRGSNGFVINTKGEIIRKRETHEFCHGIPLAQAVWG